MAPVLTVLALLAGVVPSAAFACDPAKRGDVNGDGKADFVAFYDYGAGGTRMHVWLSSGANLAYQGSKGWWGSPLYRTSEFNQIMFGDFNGDGKGDVTANRQRKTSPSGYRIEMPTWVGYVGFKYDWLTPQLWAFQSSSAAGDFDGNGLTDVAQMTFVPGDSFPGPQSASIRIAKATLTGFQLGSSAAWTYPDYERRRLGYPMRMQRFVSGDFDGNGKDDLASMYDYGNGQTAIHFWRSDGNGAFTGFGSAGWWKVYSGYDASRVRGFVCGDFNGDGRDDVAALYDYGDGNNTSAIHVWLSTGGAFSYQGRYGWFHSTAYDGNDVRGLACGDYNGDGKDDIAALYDYGSGKARIHTWLSRGNGFTFSGAAGWWGVAGGYDAGAATVVK